MTLKKLTNRQDYEKYDKTIFYLKKKKLFIKSRD